MPETDELRGLEWKEASPALIVLIRSLIDAVTELRIAIRELQRINDARAGESKMARTIIGIVCGLGGGIIAVVVQHLWK